jgi:dihydrofolate reductase
VKVSLYMGMSLDGFVARSDDRLDFLGGPAEGEAAGPDGFGAFLATVDTLVMGRRTFEVVQAFGPEGWPYGDLSLCVLSRRWSELPQGTRSSVRLMHGEPAEVVGELAAAGIRHVYVDGAETARSFLDAGLVTDLILTFVPVLIGSGISVWGNLSKDIALELVEQRVLSGGLVQVCYRVR